MKLFGKAPGRILDDRQARPYLAPMATRLLLTLLALLTGLAAQFAPAQARVARPTETEIGDIAQTSADQLHVVTAALQVAPARPVAWRLIAQASSLALPQFPGQATVLQGIDRARE